MSEQPYDPKDLPERQKEKVILSNGRFVWVWDMDAANWLQGTERAVIRTGPRAGAQSITDSLIWRVLVSCYDSDLPGARRIFNEEDVLQIYRLPSRDFRAIIDAIDRVNATDPESAEEALDFSTLREEERTAT